MEDFVLKTDRYFQLLCKLYCGNLKYQEDIYKLFKEPGKIVEKQIKRFRTWDRGKYCSLVLLVIFNNNFCFDDVLGNENLEKKFKHALAMCKLSQDTPLNYIRDKLKLLEEIFVKKVDDAYEFRHDVIMEVTSFVLGNDYPTELIQYAEIGFLLRRVTLESDAEKKPPFTIYLSEKHIEKLGKRLLRKFSKTVTWTLFFFLHLEIKK